MARQLRTTMECYGIETGWGRMTPPPTTHKTESEKCYRVSV